MAQQFNFQFSTSKRVSECHHELMALVTHFHALWYVTEVVGIIIWCEIAFGGVVLICYIEVELVETIAKTGCNAVGGIPIGIVGGR